MVNLKDLLQNPEKYKKAIIDKGYNPELVDSVVQFSMKQKELVSEVENLRAERKQLGKNNNTSIDEGKLIKEKLKQLEPEADKIQEELQRVLNQIPNPALPDVPVGKGEEDNVEIKKFGNIPQFSFEPKNHLELGEKLHILDFTTGSKVTGTQFYFLLGDGAMLELALTQFAFKKLINKGFTPVITPDLAKSRFYLGTGYVPKGNEAQTYVIEGEDLGLIATSEVTLAGRHADESIPEESLPLMYVGLSHAFRQEAGAYGKYSKGLYRVHQFSKIEMFVYSTPEESAKYHDMLLGIEEEIYQDLQIPYRVLEMCTGDLGAIAAKKYDIEAWMPGRNGYGEVTSTSNCTDYQARNLNIRIKMGDGTHVYAHMLNGTAIAISRTLIAILENYQQEDGSVIIPEILRSYMDKDVIRAA